MSNPIIPNYQEAIDFLKKWNPNGPWVITAIDPNKKGIDTGSFVAADPETCRLWLQDQGSNKRRNLYFTVNTVTRLLDSKPTRANIASMAWLHVDLDPRAGEDLDAERARILALLRNPPAPIPPPTVIVFSGGGYQGFWRLKIPLLLDGTAEQFEDAKRYNKQLELVLGGDNCHNVDRIMRVPGTINRPDPKKYKKGRREARAAVVEWSDASYDLGQFTKAPAVQRESAGFSGNTVQVSGNIQRFSSVDEIKELRDAPQCRVVIVQGLDPDNPDKFGTSRSEWLFFACCEMVRCNMSDDDIYSVITDPDFGISASVLDKGSGVESYAIRQIERAREHAIDPMLTEMNDRHAVIGSIGSKGLCRILSEEFDVVTDRKRISFQNQSDFLLRYRNKMVDYTVNGKVASKPAAIWWLEHPSRRYYDTVVFAPGKETPGSFNLWKGFAFDAVPDRGSCELYLRHVHDIVCAGDDELYEYVIRWMAWAVQHPANPGLVAIVLRGERGSGKGVFAQHFGKIWGRHFLQVTDSKHLVGSFNAHMRDCVVMYADEAFAAQDKRSESLLKTLVTESMIITEAKGVDAEPSPNFIHLIMASNEAWVIPAGPYERRFCVLDVAATKLQDGQYFAAIEDQMLAGGYEALLHFLLTMNLEGFDVRKVPKTGALFDQQEFSMTPEDEWWYDKLNSGEVFDGEGWPGYVFCSHLQYDYTEALMKTSHRVRVSSSRLLKYLERMTAKRLVKKQLTPDGPVEVIQKDGKHKEVLRPYIFELPSLEECRLIWASMGRPAAWREVGKTKLAYEDHTDVTAKETFG